jgi:cytoskeletal protein CcmA (bactofilin family)
VNRLPFLPLLWCIAFPAAAAQDDVYMAGPHLHVDNEVSGDLIAAAGTLALARPVGRDAMLAGGTLDVRAPVGDDLRAAGGSVTVSAAVGDDAIVAGGRVHLASTGTVGGRAWLAGREVVIDGRIAGELRAAGGTLALAGAVGGDVELAAETIELRPGAHIAGNLVYRSPNQARIAPGARVDGDVRQIALEAPSVGPAVHAAGRVLALAALAITGIVLYLLFPRFALAAARTLRATPWRALGLGFASLVAVPVLAVLLLASVVGIPLALALLAAYLILLLAGFLVGVLSLGELGLSHLAPTRSHSRAGLVAALILALAVLWLLRQIPVLGGLLTFLILLFGTGALLLAGFDRYGSAPSTVTAAC